MLIRIVRMTFKNEKTADFLKIFDENKLKIRNFTGCRHLELHRDYDEDNIYSTYSIWESEEALNAYRHSELFKTVWASTKELFAAKPIAHSHEKVGEW